MTFLNTSRLFSEFFGISDPIQKFEALGTTGLLVWDDVNQRPITDESLLRKIFWTHVVRTRLKFDLGVRERDFGDAADKIRRSQEGLGGVIWTSALTPESFLTDATDAAGVTGGDVSAFAEVLRLMLTSNESSDGDRAAQRGVIRSVAGQPDSSLSGPIEVAASFRTPEGRTAEFRQALQVALADDVPSVGGVELIELNELLIRSLVGAAYLADRVVLLEELIDAADHMDGFPLENDEEWRQFRSAALQVISEARVAEEGDLSPSQLAEILVDDVVNVIVRDVGAELVSKTQEEIVDVISREWIRLAPQAIARAGGGIALQHAAASAPGGIGLGYAFSRYFFNTDEIDAHATLAYKALRISELLDPLIIDFQERAQRDQAEASNLIGLRSAYVIRRFAEATFWDEVAERSDACSNCRFLIDLFTDDGYQDAVAELHAVGDSLRAIGTPSWMNGRIIDHAVMLARVRATSIFVSESIATALVLDTSGSMDDERKLETAKDVIRQLIDAEVLGTSNTPLSLVTFTDRAATRATLGSSLTDLLNEVSRFRADGDTALAVGLLEGLNSLRPAGDGPKRIIFLTDGKDGSSVTEFVGGPVARLIEAEVCLFVIGLGSDVEAELLRAGAEATGCGEYLTASDADSLRTAYIQSADLSAAGVVVASSSTIQQGQTLSGGFYVVEAGTALLSATATYPGSKIDLVLEDPDGVTVTSSYPGATLNSDVGFERVAVVQPMLGRWSVGVYGADIPSGGEPFQLSVAGAAPAALRDFAPQQTLTLGGDSNPMIVILLLVALLALGAGAGTLVVRS